jgi:hypothetical protein
VRTTKLLAPDPGEVVVSDAFGDESQLLLECGSLKVYSKKIANQLVRELTFSDWLSQYIYPVQPCQYFTGRSCQKIAGVLHTRGRFIFDDDVDTTMRAIVTYDADTSWFPWEKLH